MMSNLRVRHCRLPTSSCSHLALKANGRYETHAFPAQDRSSEMWGVVETLSYISKLAEESAILSAPAQLIQRFYWA